MKNKINPEQIINDTIKRIIERKKIGKLDQMSIKELKEAREIFEEVGMNCMRWDDALQEAIEASFKRAQKEARKEVENLVVSKNI